ncbi:MAG: hypothetical protein JWN48_5456 [Myxococcaceae bacterium]|nr:hypothetical protein [Myxococcaceae bacterium]
MLCRRPSLVASYQAALLFAVVGGCDAESDNKSDSTEQFTTDPKLVQSALTNPIIDCQTDAQKCVLSAAGDFTAVQACNDTLTTCLQTAADKGQSVATSLTQCRDEGRTCLTDGGKLDECRTGYESCAKGALDGTGLLGDAGISLPTSTLPSLPSSPLLGDGGLSLPKPGNGGGLQLPSQPGLLNLQLDSGLLDNLPPQEKCLVTLRLCVFTDPTKATTCADDAKTCLMLP